jgi:hypothetical protein
MIGSERSSGWMAPPVSGATHAPTSRERLVQLALSVLATIPLAVFSVDQLVSYDGYWHVFIAHHDRWSNFWYDVRVNTHPPLFYAALGQVLELGKTPLVYRTINIVAAMLSAYLVARIVRRCGAPRIVASAAAVAFGASWSTIHVALEVRSYMLSVLFGLLAMRGFVDLLDTDFAERTLRARLAFAAGMFLALLSHYSAGFLLAGCLAVPLLLSVATPGYGKRLLRGLSTRRAANAATFALPTLGVTFAAAHTLMFGLLNHVPEFLHDPSRESAWAFLARQAANVVGLFAPFATQPAQGIAAMLLLGLVLAAALLATRRRQPPSAIAPALVTLVAVSLVALAGVLGRYPFGGEQRHQYVMFPLLVLTVCVSVGVLANALTDPRARTLAGTMFVAAVAANAALAIDTFPRHAGRLFQAEMDRFRSAFPSPRVVYVDQFNLIAFFMHYDDWDWKFVARADGASAVEVYRVSRGAESFQVCRDLNAWVVELAQPNVYRGIADCRRSTRSESVALFALEQPGLSTPLPPSEREPERTLRRLASEAGLSVPRLLRNGGNVFAEYAAPASGN